MERETIREKKPENEKKSDQNEKKLDQNEKKLENEKKSEQNDAAFIQNQLERKQKLNRDKQMLLKNQQQEYHSSLIIDVKYQFNSIITMNYIEYTYLNTILLIYGKISVTS